MALRTQGFQLSALPSPPRIPSNIGKVDTKEIMDQVAQNLRISDELAMGAQRAQNERTALTTETAKSLGTLKRLPFAIDAGIAEDQAAAAKAPIGTETAGLNRNILASKADPATLAAENARKRAESEMAVGDAAFMNLPGMRERKMSLAMSRMMPAGVREIDMLTSELNDPNISEDRKKAIRLKLFLDAKPSSAGLQYKVIVGSDGVERLVAADPREVGATVVQGPPGAPAVAAVTPDASAGVVGASTPVGGPAAATPPVPTAPAVNAFQGPVPGTLEGAKAQAEQKAKLQMEREQKLPKAKATLAAMEDKTHRVENDIDEAINLAGPLSVGWGSLAKRLPTSQAKKMDALLSAIRSNLGFDALSEMRQNSPTGGALGNVSDYEGKTLQSTIAALDQELDVQSFISALNKVKEARRKSLHNIEAAYNTDFGLVTGESAKEALAPGGASATPAAAGGDKYVVGKKYGPDGSGLWAKYLGNGQWEEVPAP